MPGVGWYPWGLYGGGAFPPRIFDQASYVFFRASAPSSSDGLAPDEADPYAPEPGLKLFAYRWAPADGGGA